MKIKIFIKNDCPRCPQAKNLGKALEEEGYFVEWRNLNSLDGLTEASLYQIMSTPSIVLVSEGAEIKSWRGEVPTLSELEKLLKNPKSLPAGRQAKQIPNDQN